VYVYKYFVLGRIFKNNVEIVVYENIVVSDLGFCPKSAQASEETLCVFF